MATQVQWRGGSTAEHATFTGAAREITVDTQKKTLVVHDGSTAGGEPLLREDQANLPSSVTNGLYTPGTNQVALSTAGTGRLFVDASGDVGIGGSPNAALTVNRSGVMARFQTGAAADGRIEFAYNTTDVGYINAAGLNGFGVFARSGVDLQLGAGGSERLRITSDGKVGVGTSNPAYPLVVSASGASGIEFGPAFSGTANLIQHYDRSGSAYVEAVNDAALHRFNTSGTERLRITSAGLVGIGTSSPSTYGAQLAVIGGSIHADRSIGGGAAQVQFSMGASSGANFGQISNTGTRWALGYGGTANTVGTEVLTWNSSGQVGIGTTSPAHALTVNSGSISISNRGSGNSYALPDWRIYNSSSGNALVFDNYTTEAFRVDSSNRLLVGTSSSVTGAGNSLYARLQVIGNNAGTPRAGLIVIGRDEAATTMSSGDPLGVLVFTDNASGEFATIACHSDGATALNDYPSRLTFSTTADGASTPTERMRITSDAYVRLAAGTGGIQFGGDTAAANALDDYEEGTWTPVINTSNADATVAWTTGPNARYTKIGRQVHLVLYGGISVSAAGTGYPQITGIPINATTAIFAGSLSYASAFSSAGIAPKLYGTTVEILNTNSTGIGPSLQTGFIAMFISYTV